MARHEVVRPYVRGAAWPEAAGAGYPRADLTDARLPADIRAVAMLPVGVRLELVGSATAVEVGYVAATGDLGHRGAGAGTTFSAWRAGEQVDEQPASLGHGVARLHVGDGNDHHDDRVVIYLPEGMQPVITELAGVGGSIRPAPPEPRWVAYGDSIVEGWLAGGPALAWPAIAGREHGLDVVNLGYAGSARGEIASAEHIAALDADVISLAWGTNCWSRVPHSADMVRAITTAFLRVVRAGHPGTPIVVASPVVRPGAEAAPNALGATLADLREAMEEGATALGDDRVTLIPGRNLLPPELLADGVHPGDEGHRVLARAVGGAVAQALTGRESSAR